MNEWMDGGRKEGINERMKNAVIIIY